MRMLLDAGGIETVVPDRSGYLRNFDVANMGIKTPMRLAQAHCQADIVEVIASRYSSADRVVAYLLLGACCAFELRLQGRAKVVSAWSRALVEVEANREQRKKDAAARGLDVDSVDDEPDDPRFPPLPPMAAYGNLREPRTVAEMIQLSDAEMRIVALAMQERLLGANSELTLLYVLCRLRECHYQR